MRWAVVLIFAGCVAWHGAWRERVGAVERSAPACASFSEWDEKARAASAAAAKGAPADELLGSEKRLRSARLACARHVLETLVESKHAQEELDAVAVGLAEGTFDRLVRDILPESDPSLSAQIAEAKEHARGVWRNKQDARAQAFMDEASASREQWDKSNVDAISDWGLRHDVIVTGQRGSYALPDGGAATFGVAPGDRSSASQHDRQFAKDHDRLAAESAEHDRQAAATTTGGGYRSKDAAADDARLAAESAAHDRQFARDHAILERAPGTSASDDARLAAESAAHDRQFRADAAQLSSVAGSAPGAASEKPSGVSSESWSRLQPALQRARVERKPDAAAALLEPFRDDPLHGSEAKGASDEAARLHLALAREAGTRAHAAALHRALAARFTAGASAAAAGTFVFERWLCPGEKPAAPVVAAGVSIRLRVRCQTSQPRPAPGSEKEPTFDSERELVKTVTDGVASVTCARQSFERTVHRESISMDDPGEERRRLDDDLRNVAREARSQCETLARGHAADCAALDTVAPLEVEERFAAHALSPNGPWPACFTEWFRAKYGVTP